MKPCIFCGGGSSREHILAKWLIRDCDLENQRPHIGFGAMQNGRFETVSQEQKLSQFLLSSVCVQCNGGWMSRLENRAKQTLSPFLQPEWPELDLTMLEQLRPFRTELTMWLLKTAITFGEKMSVRVPGFIKSDLPGGKIHPGTSVDLACGETPALFVAMTRQWTVVVGDEMAMRQHPDSFRFTMQVRHLILRISYFPYTERLQRKPRYPVVIFPGFRILEGSAQRSDSGILCIRKPYVYPDVKVFEDETTYRETQQLDPVADLQNTHSKILPPWAM